MNKLQKMKLVGFKTKIDFNFTPPTFHNSKKNGSEKAPSIEFSNHGDYKNEVSTQS